MQDACLHVVVSMTLGWGKQRSLCMGANQDNSGYVTGYSTLGGCIYDVFFGILSNILDGFSRRSFRSKKRMLFVLTSLTAHF